MKRAVSTLLPSLREDDRLAIVTYAGSAGVALPSTPGTDRAAIEEALHLLEPAGGTRGSAGIERAYQIARENRIDGGINRVLLATDGDFNLGVTDRGSLTRLIEKEAATGVGLTVLGFGTGNFNDAGMEELSNLGDGNYAYVSSAREAERVLGSHVGGTLQTIAKDVKLQVEFNPAAVAAYRLIGYENRVLADADFNDDLKDAGDVGAGHEVTALYEIVPAGGAVPDAAPPVDELKYQKVDEPASLRSDELLTVKLRWKQPDAPKERGTSQLAVFPLAASDTPFAAADPAFRFASAVAGWGMLLREKRAPRQRRPVVDPVDRRIRVTGHELRGPRPPERSADRGPRRLRCPPALAVNLNAHAPRSPPQGRAATRPGTPAQRVPPRQTRRAPAASAP